MPFAFARFYATEKCKRAELCDFELALHHGCLVFCEYDILIKIYSEAYTVFQNNSLSYHTDTARRSKSAEILSMNGRPTINHRIWKGL